MHVHELARRIIKHCNCWDVDDIADILRACGISIVGTGAYGIVIDCGNYVTKFFTVKDHAYQAFVDLAINHPSPMLPVFYEYQRVNKFCLEASMEKLNRLGDNKADYIHFRSLCYRSNVEGEDEEVELSDLMEVTKVAFCDLGFWLTCDLHYGNAMRRNDGQLVITDPWCD